MLSAPFSTTLNKQSVDWKTSQFLTVCRKAVSHIFADICTPRARLQKRLSKDGFWTLEYCQKPLAGHLYGLEAGVFVLSVESRQQEYIKIAFPFAKR